MDHNLLDLITHELGEIAYWEEECPGVYYLSILPTIGCGGEYYAVMEDAPVSQEVRATGRQLEECPVEECPVLVYLLEGEDGAWAAVEYEVLRYLTQHNLPLPEGKSLRESALYGMELCPDYFGTYPVPPLTPWGVHPPASPAGQRNLLDRNGSVHEGAGSLPSCVGFRATRKSFNCCPRFE